MSFKKTHVVKPSQFAPITRGGAKEKRRNLPLARGQALFTSFFFRRGGGVQPVEAKSFQTGGQVTVGRRWQLTSPFPPFPPPPPPLLSVRPFFHLPSILPPSPNPLPQVPPGRCDQLNNNVFSPPCPSTIRPLYKTPADILSMQLQVSDRLLVDLSWQVGSADESSLSLSLSLSL